MKPYSKSALGVAVALAVAGIAGCVSETPRSTASSGALGSGTGATTDLAHCYNANVCKGHNACKTASNACAGHGACKGQGFVALPTKACADVGGEVQDKWRGSVANTDLLHCYGANVCKGHNDCKTASNACAGQGSCKGQGFVAVPKKVCADIGGTIGA